ncbi:glutathione S-transferase D1-like [Sabethes cyaneus]|uniref:glutathione S-transferase D1-like n=1 Tax=Sabethes cyaneus TaxID=53552 RepID=UPI00237DA48D|nr:glutathione S-transferase D1-like [Sabethes cyaneus]
MDLYYAIVSPPSQAVVLLAKYLGVPLNLKSVNLQAGEHVPEKINPQQSLPTLTTEDGVAIWESNAIMLYLVERFDKAGKIYPTDPVKRAVVFQRIFFDMGTLFKQLRAYFAPIVMHGASPDESALKEVEKAFTYLEQFLAGSKFAAGDELTLADFALITSVMSAISMKLDITKYPNVDRWVKLCKSTLPGIEEVQKEAEVHMKTIRQNPQKN